MEFAFRNVLRIGGSLNAAVRLLNIDRFFYKLDTKCPYHGGNIVANTLKMHGVSQVFTLCGGHVSPVLTGCEEVGIRVIDTRHEASAAFAADAASRLTGIPGVCVVTAGPGLTNTVTAVKNAQMAETPLILIGGAAPTLLKGRGALQDIDQLSVFRSLCKDRIRVTRVRHLQDCVSRAIETAANGVPGPVLLELPVDILYPQEIVREMAGIRSNPRGLKQKLTNWYITLAVNAVFAGATFDKHLHPRPVLLPLSPPSAAKHLQKMIAAARRPVIVLGSQATLPGGSVTAQDLAFSLNKLQIPAYLGGMCRGLLGPDHPLFFRQGRRKALKEADLIILAGAVCDFRLDYGRSLNSKAQVVMINRSKAHLKLNRGIFWRASLLIESDVASALKSGAFWGSADAPAWIKQLREQEEKEEENMSSEGEKQLEGGVNPVLLFQILDSLLTDNSILIGDGGDFVGTASRILRPRKPLSWLDPGAYGTLGVGGGFALGVKTVRPDAEVWVLWGDGSSTYSIAEIEPAVRNNLPFIAIIGNNGCWGQIARDQSAMLGSDAACMLGKATPYHHVAEGYGALGLLIDEGATRQDMEDTLRHAQEQHAAGRTVVVNVILGKSDFRDGSISL